MVQESCSNVLFRKIIAAWKKEWAHSADLRGGMRPAVGAAGASRLAQGVQGPTAAARGCRVGAAP